MSADLTEMTPNPWYEAAEAGMPITQGDLIFDCPLIAWKPGPVVLQGSAEGEVLQSAIVAVNADVIVMTQACDLEHGKVENVLVCPHLSLADYRSHWEAAMLARGNTPTAKAWRNQCEDIRDGYVWNQTLLNAGELAPLRIEQRVVDFHEVFTVPRSFLESLLEQRARLRLRLLPPYREHLSQAFARFFMRVGLPVPVEKAW